MKYYSRDDLKKILSSASENIYLDIGCGARKKQDHIGVDKISVEGVDINCDIEAGLPIADNSVDGIYSNYFLEHVKDLIFVFQEIYRVCKNGARVELLVPYYTSINAFKDPTHRQFFTEETFKYFSKDKWYGSDYNINTNFRLLEIKYHYSRIVKLFPFFKKYIRRHIINSVGAMTVKLEVIK